MPAFQQPVLYPCRSIYCTGFGLSLSSSLASHRRGKGRICGAFYHSMICRVYPCSCSGFGAILELLPASCRTCTVCRSSLLASSCLSQIHHQPSQTAWGHKKNKRKYIRSPSILCKIGIGLIHGGGTENHHLHHDKYMLVVPCHASLGRHPEECQKAQSHLHLQLRELTLLQGLSWVRASFVLV